MGNDVPCVLPAYWLFQHRSSLTGEFASLIISDSESLLMLTAYFPKDYFNIIPWYRLLQYKFSHQYNHVSFIRAVRPHLPVSTTVVVIRYWSISDTINMKEFLVIQNSTIPTYFSSAQIFSLVFLHLNWICFSVNSDIPRCFSLNSLFKHRLFCADGENGVALLHT
jgi:hypothetical protein